MFVVNDDNSIYVTRGDAISFSVIAKENDSDYLFKQGDVVRFKVYGKKDAENVVLSKDFYVEADTNKVDILLTEKDTKIGEVISKPKDYWYEVELNPFSAPQTIIGYNEDGATVFKLFPEGDDVDTSDGEITEDDIPIVDEELDPTSTRPVQNQAIARAITKLEVIISKIDPSMSDDLANLALADLKDDPEHRLVTDEQLEKLAGIEAGANFYMLPSADEFVIGGVIDIGQTNTTIRDGLVSVNDYEHKHKIENIDGLQAALNSASYTLPTASATVKGGIKVGDGLSIDSSGVLSALATGGGDLNVVSFDTTLTPSNSTQLQIPITNPNLSYYVYCLHVHLKDASKRDVSHTMFGFFTQPSDSSTDINKPAINTVKVRSASISTGLPTTATVLPEMIKVTCTYDLSGANIGNSVTASVHGWYKAF